MFGDKIGVDYLLDLFNLFAYYSIVVILAINLAVLGFHLFHGLVVKSNLSLQNTTLRPLGICQLTFTTDAQPV